MTERTLKSTQDAWAAACRTWSRDDCSDVMLTMKRGEAMMYAATDLIVTLEAHIENLRADKLLMLELIDAATRLPPQKAINTLREAVRQARAARKQQPSQ
ncbi:MAG: hypothetical protein DI552_00315 [Brevundimonas sp.]|uniref:hypothetical protein n=1 Tax=Brevundimonas sp. TaxID=1871086 RepID=UPI000DBBD36D|nr:hypothetical protein [Brevundimonas sp.]PZU62347.1 MAG: hypothetical protein DI552_00315 [Brevundimonas sp.]